MTVPCKICKAPVTVNIPSGSYRHDVEKLLPLATHNRCYDQKVNAQKAAQMFVDEKARLESWQAICPPEYRKALNWEKPKSNRDIYKSIMDWKFGPKGLLVTGATGYCKTRFVYKLLEREYLAGRKVQAYTHPEWRRMTSQFAESDMRAAGRFIAMLSKLDILFIDDLGKGRITPATEEAFEDLIDARAKFNRPTFFTTNCTKDSLLNMLSEDRGEAIIRRIVEFCTTIDVSNFIRAPRQAAEHREKYKVTNDD